MSNGNTVADKYPVPPGFRSLLESLAREVLRNQPTDIYAFSALFFERLAVFRKAKRDPQPDKRQVITIILRGAILNNLENGRVPTLGADEYNQFKRDLHEAAVRENLLASRASQQQQQRRTSSSDRPAPPPRPATTTMADVVNEEQAAIRIQAAFRGHKSRADANTTAKPEISGDPQLTEEEERAAQRIQAEVRGMLARKQVNKMRQEMDTAAITIQKQFRGFKQRQMERTASQGQLRASGSETGSQGSIHFDGTMDEERAALAIQRNFKGFKARKEYKQERDAAIKIQSAFRGHATRRNRNEDDDDDLK